ncbi:MAG: type II toxin-antitoxin system HicA family toxin [Candidatus Scalindua sp.]
MKVKELLKLLKTDGWNLSRTRGSYRQFKHPSNQAQLQSLVSFLLTCQKEH